jgi:hypothetical protein
MAGRIAVDLLRSLRREEPGEQPALDIETQKRKGLTRWHTSDQEKSTLP